MDGMDRVDRHGPYGQNGRGSEVYSVQLPLGAASSPRMRGAPGGAIRYQDGRVWVGMQLVKDGAPRERIPG
jgi:hypothetical protein